MDTLVAAHLRSAVPTKFDENGYYRTHALRRPARPALLVLVLVIVGVAASVLPQLSTLPA